MEPGVGVGLSPAWERNVLRVAFATWWVLKTSPLSKNALVSLVVSDVHRRARVLLLSLPPVQPGSDSDIDKTFFLRALSC